MSYDDNLRAKAFLDKSRSKTPPSRVAESNPFAVIPQTTESKAKRFESKFSNYRVNAPVLSKGVKGSLHESGQDDGLPSSVDASIDNLCNGDAQDARRANRYACPTQSRGQRLSTLLETKLLSSPIDVNGERGHGIRSGEDENKNPWAFVGSPTLRGDAVTCFETNPGHHLQLSNELAPYHPGTQQIYAAQSKASRQGDDPILTDSLDRQSVRPSSQARLRVQKMQHESFKRHPRAASISGPGSRNDDGQNPILSTLRRPSQCLGNHSQKQYSYRNYTIVGDLLDPKTSEPSVADHPVLEPCPNPSPLFEKKQDSRGDDEHSGNESAAAAAVSGPTSTPKQRAVKRDRSDGGKNSGYKHMDEHGEEKHGDGLVVGRGDDDYGVGTKNADVEAAGRAVEGLGPGVWDGFWTQISWGMK